MKSFALLTSEAKPPLQLVSLFHFFVSEAASFLHQPRRGGFIAKSPCRSKCFLPGRNPAVVTLRSGSEAARFAHREVLRLTPQSEVKRSAIVPQAHFTREARLHVRRTLHVPRKRNASLQKALAFASAFCLAGAEGLEQALLRCPKIAAGDGAPLRFSTAAPAAPHIADKTGAQRRRVRFWEEKGPGFVKQLRLPEPRSIPGTSDEAELGAAARHVSRASGPIRLLRACKRPGRWFGLLHVNELPKGHLSIKKRKAHH